MPSRVLHESFLDSPSVEALSPSAQDAFPRFLLIADDFGCFEVNLARLRALGWSRRPDVTEEHVGAWLAELAERRAVDPATGAALPPMLMVWTHAGRRYAHLTGWNGPHGQKRRAEYDPRAPVGTPGRHGSKRKTPPPPGDLLAAVLAGTVRAVDGRPPGTDRETGGNTDSEIPNLSVPARELAVSRPVPAEFPPGARQFPAPAVAVPVPGAGAGGANGAPRAAAAAVAFVDPPSPRLAVVGEPEAAPWPLAEAFRVALADALARTAPHPIGATGPGAAGVLDAVERALAALGGAEAIPAAVERCRARVFEAVGRHDRQPATLKFFLAVLGDALTERAAGAAAGRRVVRVTGIDPETGDLIEEPIP